MHSGSVLQLLPIDEETRRALEACKEVNILVMGCYNVGKSTLINSLFYEKGKRYEQKAKEGSLAPCTQDVKPYELEVNGINFNIYDSPGLQDGDKKDEVYMRKIKEKCSTIHLVIYCTKMGEPIRPAEHAALKNITSTFGEAIWKNAVIVLTFANQVEPADPHSDEKTYFEEMEKKKTAQVAIAFQKLSISESELIQHIYPAGSARVLKLPGKEHDWRLDLLEGCLKVCNQEAKGALLELAATKSYVMATVGAATSIASGAVSMLGGAVITGAGIALAATGGVVPLGLAFLIGGAVGSLLGGAATTGGAIGLAAIEKEKAENKGANSTKIKAKK